VLTLADTAARLTEQINSLRRDADGTQAAHTGLAHDAAESLASAVEALGIAQEALSSQSETLAAARSALEEMRHRYRRFIDLTPDAFLITDPRGVVLETNRAVSALAGFARSYIHRKPLTVLVFPEDVARFTREIAGLRAERGDRVREFRTRLRARRQDPPIQVRVWVAPVHDRDGELTTLLWLIRDVSNEVQQAAQLDRQRAEHDQQLRTRTMELEAIVRMQATALGVEKPASSASPSRTRQPFAPAAFTGAGDVSQPADPSGD